MEPPKRRAWLEKAKRPLGLLAAGLGMYLALSVWLAWLYVHPMKEPAAPDLPGAMAELIPVPGRSQPLPASVIQGSRPIWLLLAHGYGGAPDQFHAAASEAANGGVSVALLSMRGHTNSPVGSVTFGPGEADEIAAAARWVKQREPGAVVVACGISLGGAASWLAAASAPDAIDAVASDGAFARLDWGLEDYQSAMGPAGRLLFGPMNQFASMILGFGPEKVRPDLAARAWRGRPALIIHPEEDQMFPSRHRDLLQKESGAEVWNVPGARHAEPVEAEPQEYAARLIALAERALKARGAR